MGVRGRNCTADSAVLLFHLPLSERSAPTAAKPTFNSHGIKLYRTLPLIPLFIYQLQIIFLDFQILASGSLSLSPSPPCPNASLP